MTHLQNIKREGGGGSWKKYKVIVMWNEFMMANYEIVEFRDPL